MPESPAAKPPTADELMTEIRRQRAELQARFKRAGRTVRDLLAHDPRSALTERLERLRNTVARLDKDVALLEDVAHRYVRTRREEEAGAKRA